MTEHKFYFFHTHIEKLVPKNAAEGDLGLFVSVFDDV